MSSSAHLPPKLVQAPSIWEEEGPTAQNFTHTQQAGNAWVSGVSRVQVHFMWVEPSRCNCQVAAEPVNVLDQGDVHFQGPLAGSFLGMSGIDAGTPGGAGAD